MGSIALEHPRLHLIGHSLRPCHFLPEQHQYQLPPVPRQPHYLPHLLPSGPGPEEFNTPLSLFNQAPRLPEKTRPLLSWEGTSWNHGSILRTGVRNCLLSFWKAIISFLRRSRETHPAQLGSGAKNSDGKTYGVSVCYLSFEGCGKDRARSQEPREGTGRQGGDCRGRRRRRKCTTPPGAGVTETMMGKASGQGDGAGHS